MNIEILRLPHAKDLPLPAYATEGSAGLDLLAAIDADTELKPGARAAIPTGIALAVNLGSGDALRVLAGVIAGLVVGKPLGILIASAIAVKSGFGLAPRGVAIATFVGAACLCGVGDTVALLIADEAFPHGAVAGVAKIGVLTGSILSAIVGAARAKRRSAGSGRTTASGPMPSTRTRPRPASRSSASATMAFSAPGSRVVFLQ